MGDITDARVIGHNTYEVQLARGSAYAIDYCLNHGINISRETWDQLGAYVDMLVAWQSKMNLISKHTVPNIWERHVLDSMSILPFVPEGAQTFFDFGAGAGLPGVVLSAVMGMYGYYIESSQKKSMFLTEVIRNLKLPAESVCSRIEQIFPQDDLRPHRIKYGKGVVQETFQKQSRYIFLPKPDLIISRAMASLRDLMNYAQPFMKSGQTYLFLKGKTLQDEIDLCDTMPGKYDIFPSIGGYGYIFRLVVE